MRAFQESADYLKDRKMVGAYDHFVQELQHHDSRVSLVGRLEDQKDT